MISPFERLEELNVSPKSNYRCLELSPNGMLYAAATTNSIEIWSAQGEVMLLARCPQQRPSGYSKALLNRIFLLWNDSSDSIVVLRSEGIVDFYDIAYGTRSLEDVYSEQDTSITVHTASLNIRNSVSIEQFGYPICTCLYDKRIIVASDNGMICELNWKGDSVGRPLSRFVPLSILDSSISLTDKSVFSLSVCQELKCLALALSNGSCLLLDMSSSSSKLPVHATLFHTNTVDGVRTVQFCPGLPLLAVTSSRLTVDIYRISRDPTLQVSRSTTIDVRQFPRVSNVPLYAYDSIISLCWCPGQITLALGLRYQGIIVWSYHTGVLFTYNGNVSSYPVAEDEEALQCSGVASSTEISCCAFSMTGSSLLFNVPYEQVISAPDNQVYSRDSRLFLQRFMITPNVILATYYSDLILTNRENCSVFGHSDTMLYHLHTSDISSFALLPSFSLIPYEFLSCSELILDQVQSPSGNSLLLYTYHSICLYQSTKAHWTQAIHIASVYDKFDTHS